MRKLRFFLAAALAGFVLFSLNACNEDGTEPIPEGIAKATLTLTEVTGEGVEAHGDHFHGLGSGVEGESVTITFDETGKATSGGHLHIEADAVYKIELKAWDYDGKEVQNDFIASKAVADQYKAFILGGGFVLNPDSDDEHGAIFQPREQAYGDGAKVEDQYGTTGVLAYFTVGHDNEGATKAVTYVLRKLDAGVKPTISRLDWNRTDYAAAFPGRNVLELKFEIHAEEGHQH